MIKRRTVTTAAALALLSLLPVTGAKGAPGTEANGESTTGCTEGSGRCTNRTLSSDGRRIVFASAATNLVDGDTNGAADVFLAVIAGDGSFSLRRLSVPDPASGGSGGQADDVSGSPSISPNGEWVAFESRATNLTGGDTNAVADVFLYHVPDGRLIRVSVPDPSTGQAQGDRRSVAPVVADDGTVAFTSFATNLVTAGGSPSSGVYVRHPAPAGTEIISVGAGGEAADGDSRQASISADGNRVAFVSSASNIDDDDDDDDDDDVFLHVAGAGTFRVTTGARAETPSLRPDGQVLAFVSEEFDDDDWRDVILSNPDGSAALVMSDCPCSPAADRSAHSPSLAAGSGLAFQSQAPFGVAPTTEQIWVRTGLGTPVLVSRQPGGPLPDGTSEFPSISGDGNRIVFTSRAANLVNGDDNDRSDVFLHDLAGGALVRLSQQPSPGSPLLPPGGSPGPSPTPPSSGAPEPVGYPVRTGYWMLDDAGNVYAFGRAPYLGGASPHLGHTHPADIEPTRSGNGYWVVDRRGRIFTFGDAAYHGNAERTDFAPDEKVTSISATPGGGGYWIFTTRGRVVTLGDATHFGDMSEVTLNGPVLDSIPTPSGRGYYMVASDGGIFSFGDAKFHGSMGGIPLNAPVQSLVPDPDGVGYWLVASDGGVFSFQAPFRGSMGSTPLNQPVSGMVPFGNGYLMVAGDGGIFNFSDLPFFGSLGDNPPAEPVIAVAVR